MKIKLLVVFLLINGNLIAQNSTLSKKYFERAKKELKAKNYKKALTYIKKCKEYAGGTNEEIIYLELQTRHIYDVNINKTIALCKTFSLEAFEGDQRLKTVSMILNTYRDKNKFYKNGNKKQQIFKYKYSKKIIFLSENGSRNKSMLYSNEGRLKETIIYNPSSNKIRLKHQLSNYRNSARVDKYFTFYDINGEKKITINVRNPSKKEPYLEVEFFSESKRNLYYTVLYKKDVMDYSNILNFKFANQIKIPNDYRIPNQKVNKGYMVGEKYVSNYVKNPNYKGALVLETFPISSYLKKSISPFFLNFTNGPIKKFKYFIKGNKYAIGEISKGGIPTNLYIYRGNRLKKTITYNRFTNKWIY